MNDAALKELKIVVEQAVRPIRATLARKRRMREELLAHLVSIFEEEAERVGDEQTALDQAKRRFGNPRELTGQLQESVSPWGRVRFVLETYTYQPGDSVLRLAAVSLLSMVLMIAGLLLAAMLVSLLRARHDDFGMLVHVSLATGVVMAAFSFVFLFLSERTARALCGEDAERSLSKVVLYCLASLVVFPALAFVTYLVLSFDLAASVAHFCLACYFAPAMPLLFLLMARPMIEEIRYKRQWASLEIGE